MRCAMHKQGETRPDHAEAVLWRGETTVVIKVVSTQICEE